MSFFYYAATRTAQHLFGQITTWLVNTGPLVSLWIGNPLPGYTGGVEVSAASYTPVTTVPGDWTINLFGQVVNRVALTFPLAEEYWGAVDYVVLTMLTSEAPEIDFPLLYGALLSTYDIDEDSIPKFLPGDLTIVFG